MKKLTLLLILLFALLTAATTADWVEVSDNNFSILFPKQPESEKEKVPTAAGEVIMDIKMLETEEGKDDNLVYSLITAIYDSTKISADKMDNLDKFYAGAIDGTVGNVKGKLLSSGKTMLGKIEGREMRIDFMEGAAIIYMRCYLVKNRFYTIQTISPFNKENNPDAVRFHQSFKLK